MLPTGSAIKKEIWLNVPVGLLLLPLATQLRESYGPDRALDGHLPDGVELAGVTYEQIVVPSAEPELTPEPV